MVDGYKAKPYIWGIIQTNAPPRKRVPCRLHRRSYINERSIQRSFRSRANIQVLNQGMKGMKYKINNSVNINNLTGYIVGIISDKT